MRAIVLAGSRGGGDSGGNSGGDSGGDNGGNVSVSVDNKIRRRYQIEICWWRLCCCCSASVAFAAAAAAASDGSDDCSGRFCAQHQKYSVEKGDSHANAVLLKRIAGTC